jgi:cell division protein FtsB
MNQVLSNIPSWLKSKYFISFTAFIIVILFLDRNDFFAQIDRRRELRKLEKAKEYYSTEIESERKELEALKTKPATLEKYAREKYLMKRDNEDLFIIQEKKAEPKK